ncbi:uncharacterized protein LOC142167248 [Nicotiana tabacum]|uniref:Uncharacterized protein LOC142167248 n=1 Tax=Nicotiana tabacum TaxID=4097 RepID=A0AC58SEV5_TOBAC
MDVLKNRVFRKFLELNEVSHSGKLTHCMLLSQLFYKDKSKMVFKVFGHDVAFTEDDFHTITRLKIETSDYSFVDARVNSLKEWYFSEVKKGLKVETLYKFMQKRSRLRDGTTDDVCVDVEVCDEDVVKLAQIYLLEVILLGKFKGRNISDRSMKIIDGEELCVSFPWGSLCFDEFIDNLSHLLTTESVKKKSIGRIPSYTALGFPFLFKLWIMKKFKVFKVNPLSLLQHSSKVNISDIVNRVSAKVENIIRADQVNFQKKMKKNIKATRKR